MHPGHPPGSYSRSGSPPIGSPTARTDGWPLRLARSIDAVYTCVEMRSLRYAHITLLALGAWLFCPQAGSAQEGLRLGLSFGGTGFIGVVAEWLWEDRGAELLVTTFSFRDVSISVVGKQYFGNSALRPVVGGGLWYLTGRSPEGSGAALAARFPIGGDWRIAGSHHLTLEVNVARGLWVRRPEPSDDFPISDRFIPIPGMAYRVGGDG